MESEDKANPIATTEEAKDSREATIPTLVQFQPENRNNTQNGPEFAKPVEKAVFKVPTPRTYGKQGTSKPSKTYKVSRKHNVTRKTPAPSNLSRNSKPKWKTIRLETAQKLLSVPPVKKKEQEVTSDPSVLFRDILSDVVKSSMRPLTINKVVRKPEKTTGTNFLQLNPMDPLMLYGITLHRYANNMYEMIRVAELAIESSLIPPDDAAPPLPNKLNLKPRRSTNGLNFMHVQKTSNLQEIKAPFPEIGSTVVRQILYQSTCAIVGLLGFEKTHESVLDVLVDVLTEFLKKIAYRFKLALQDEQRNWLSDFPNIAERVLVELGMGGCRGLHDYYQSRVVGYIELLERHCDDLSKQYKNLIMRQIPPTDDPKLRDVAIKVEVEEDVVEIDTPQVQIAINEELDLPSLDVGFQLLSSLEAGT